MAGRNPRRKSEAHGPGWVYELKKHKGIGGDPEAQCIADCEKLLADKTTLYGKIRDQSRLPTILISQAGAQLDIAVVIYAEVVLVDQLFSINLRDGIEVDKQVLRLARLATCLTKTCAELSQYYRDLRQATAPVFPLIASALHLPAPASATPPHSLLSDDLGLKFLSSPGLPENLSTPTTRPTSTLTPATPCLLPWVEELGESRPRRLS
ncbi:hypothetical protein B0H17DRAFT_116212 [Mycena rosella]|uniref:Uncharacterized protein n=1 Tax=Mycena rosella TaxID=1033263 RepID=A0AAD7D3I8_MYCRO|nr:hypothetical protein B0H17DRAFT_116212 [Mycena rosella]